MLRCEKANQQIGVVFCTNTLGFKSNVFNILDFHTEFIVRNIYRLDKVNLHVDCNNINMGRRFGVLEVFFLPGNLYKLTDSAQNNV